ncbi:unnamed protein product [Amoebophrya sp. A120]|nr:unnamed protein product [Amoebophrya sp. A120]|eukprot:GSA120T00019918001.1
MKMSRSTVPESCFYSAGRRFSLLGSSRFFALLPVIICSAGAVPAARGSFNGGAERTSRASFSPLVGNHYYNSKSTTELQQTKHDQHITPAPSGKKATSDKKRQDKSTLSLKINLNSKKSAPGDDDGPRENEIETTQEDDKIKSQELLAHHKKEQLDETRVKTTSQDEAAEQHDLEMMMSCPKELLKKQQPLLSKSPK